MARILVVYGTLEGQTRKIAEFLSQLASDAGHDAEVLAVEAVMPAHIMHADAVLLAASIHVGKHKPAVHDFVRLYRDSLAAMPAAFLSVSLSAADPLKHEDALGYVDAFLAQTGWQPELRGVAGGALRYSEYGVLKRMLMKHIARSHGLPSDTSTDQELTDWGHVREFGAAFLHRVEAVARA